MSNKDLALGLFVMFIWGINFAVIKLGVSEVNPLVVTAMRFTLAAIPLVFFVKKPDVPWRYLISYGVVFGLGVWGMASWSVTEGLTVGMAAVLLQVNVLFGLTIGALVFKESITPVKLAGFVLALMGLVTALIATNGTATLSGVMLILTAALSWSVVSTIVKKSGTTQVFAFSLWGMLFAPVPLLGLAVFLHGPAVLTDSIEAWNWQVSFSVIFQAYPTTLFGYWVWNKLLVKYPMSTATPLTLLVPVFGLIGGYVVFEETMSLMQTLASLLILAGILVIVFAPKLTALRDKKQGVASSMS
ncbi:EamA family transporter [Vibrio tapetis subsp. quintayensis]|uniref:EamA family transporter n=1 Tax=Vibrio tapetis TaxID=52443 RepID=UPI0025B51610|nr:EamA family transporter [Vibrio tapetis]MDN3681949.1 EamA family transporter [Vibrio tapetis subsp. quintayensis]